MLHGASIGKFAIDLKREIRDDNVFNGAAALGYYLTLALFPALILVMTILPYLPVPQLDQSIMGVVDRALPEMAAGMIERVLQQVMSDRKGGLLSASLALTLWAASTGMYAIMKQLNITYDAPEKRGFLHGRAVALALSLVFIVLVVAAFSLIVLGSQIQEWLGLDGAISMLFAMLRWLVVVALLLAGFAIIYRYAPNVDHDFRLVSPGSVTAATLLILASLAFSFYVSNFANYGAAYGSIGAVIVLMLWLYLAGLVILLGSEINALLERRRPR